MLRPQHKTRSSCRTKQSPSPEQSHTVSAERLAKSYTLLLENYPPQLVAAAGAGEDLDLFPPHEGKGQSEHMGSVPSHLKSTWKITQALQISASLSSPFPPPCPFIFLQESSIWRNKILMCNSNGALNNHAASLTLPCSQSRAGCVVWFEAHTKGSTKGWRQK